MRAIRTLGLVMLFLSASSAEAAITRLEILRTEPAFGGQGFGAVGPYERVVARAHGEVDPRHSQNAIIQDLALAPRNARGMVEYVTDVGILKPADMGRGNRVLMFEVLNRGNKVRLQNFNLPLAASIADRNALASPGDGFLMREGYTLVWFGWQADVLPGLNRLTLTVPVAREPDGRPITGNINHASRWNFSSGHLT